MKLIIAGGRDYTLGPEQFEWLDTIKELAESELVYNDPITEVVSGGATGADAGGEEWAKRNELSVKIFRAQWGTHGRAAGPKRNKEMAEYADALALFPGGAGSRSMKTLAKANGLTIFTY